MSPDSTKVKLILLKLLMGIWAILMILIGLFPPLISKYGQSQLSYPKFTAYLFSGFQISSDGDYISVSIDTFRLMMFWLILTVGFIAVSVIFFNKEIKRLFK